MNNRRFTLAHAARAAAGIACLLSARAAFADTQPAYSHDGDQKTTNLYWMSYMHDSVLMNQMSVPGSHDTMSYGYQPGFGLGGLFTGQNIPTDLVPIPRDNVVTQSMDLATQLNSGIRMVDIRCKAISNQFLIYHGDFYVGATFEDVLNTVTTFLTNHPGEAVFMRVTNEVAGAPLNAVPDTVNSTLSWEQVFALYYYSSRWGNFFFHPVQGDQYFYNPSLGQIRGKIVVLQDFNASQTYGIRWSNFQIQDNYSVANNFELYNKWLAVKGQLENSAGGSPSQGYINFLSGAGALSMPYFVASGKSSPGTNDPLLWTALVSDTYTGVNVGMYPDFPRLNCATIQVWTPSWSDPFHTTADNICSIYFGGTNMLADSYLQSKNSANQFVRTGIMVGDFFGPSLIDRVIKQNSNLTTGATFSPGQLPQPGGGVNSCLSRFAPTVLADNGWQKLIWQSDGNLVIYDEKGPRWATGTNTATVSSLCWQGDGNLVVYDPGRPNGVSFATNTNGRGARLTFQTDCNLVIYDSSGRPTWASGSSLPCAR
jgi:1-phosphatidylinositol phosphodiesterase